MEGEGVGTTWRNLSSAWRQAWRFTLFSTSLLLLFVLYLMCMAILAPVLAHQHSAANSKPMYFSLNGLESWTRGGIYV